MQRHLFLLFVMLISRFTVLGTAQVPDLLIYNGDTLQLMANPLEDYYNESNMRPSSFGIHHCTSTACWRGYQATWLIENNILYLVKIGNCCFIRRHSLSEENLTSLSGLVPDDILEKIRRSIPQKTLNEYDLNKYLAKKLGKKRFKKWGDLIAKHTSIPERVADLKHLFQEKYQNGRVRADWFSGLLRSPSGKLVDYVHMGYMSTFESELVFELEKGEIIDSREYHNKPLERKAGFGMLSATSYSLYVPLEFLGGKPYEYIEGKEILLVNSDSTTSIMGKSGFNEQRLKPEIRRDRVTAILDSLTQARALYDFESPIKDDLRWGSAGWADGYNSNTGEFIRVFTMVNINGYMILVLRFKTKYEEFLVSSEHMIRTTRLMEFSF